MLRDGRTAAAACGPRRSRTLRSGLPGVELSNQSSRRSSMKSRLWGRVVHLLALALMAGCASQPVPDDGHSSLVVTRTSNLTSWATPEAAAAAAAPPAATRPGPGRGPGAAVRPARAASAAQPASAAADGAAPPQTAPAQPTEPLVYFDFDSYDVKDEYRAMIETHGRTLAADRGRALVVEGHADERGGAEYNLALGQRRAEAVVKVLLLLGVNPTQVEAVSFGDTRPVSREANEAAWAKNRRAEIKER
jgi:peptidoglycan-associated lipoprotein